MHCTYYGMPKGMSREKATLNSETIALAAIELRLPEVIRQAGRQAGR